MIYDFEMAWDANNAQLIDYFRTNRDEHPSYEDLVKLLFDLVVNPFLKDMGREVYDTVPHPIRVVERIFYLTNYKSNYYCFDSKKRKYINTKREFLTFFHHNI
jgi:hypothetical protein